jgi:uncharacterized protein (DUF1501 family)
MDRRRFLTLSLGSAIAAGLVGRRAFSAAAPKAKAVILLYMEGGASHIDTFDPKPGRDVSGGVKAIKTGVAGIQIAEHLPLLAKRMKRIALVRSMQSKEGNHARARTLMHTGYAPQGGVDAPAMGALVAEQRGAGDLPGYVAIGGAGEDAGFLGAAWSPFPVRDPTKPVRFLEPARGVDADRLERRVSLRRLLDDDFAAGRPSTIPAAQRDVADQAVSMMRAADVSAFSLDGESDATKAIYGETQFGAGCLMARRLIEVGVPFVEVTQRGWDTHRDNLAQAKTLCADLDRGFAALIGDLEARGLLDETLIVWMGDFGRTPRINENGGRDHHPRCFTVALAGGGVPGGQIVGESDEDAFEPKHRAITVPDLWRTIATLVGLDTDRVRTAPSGRPIKTVDGGTIVKELL